MTPIPLNSCYRLDENQSQDSSIKNEFNFLVTLKDFLKID